MMSEMSLVVGEADAGLRERLDEEISAFNAAVTGHHDGRSRRSCRWLQSLNG
jgi:hypothetical protein